MAGIDEEMLARPIQLVDQVIIKPDSAQSAVAWAVSKMTAHHPKCRDDFAKNNVISLLINHLAFETIQLQQQQHEWLNSHDAYYQTSTRQVVAVVPLRNLCKGNANIFSNSTDQSRSLLCFAFLLEEAHVDVKYHSAMALIEITAMAEQNVELRQSGFNLASPAVKAVVEQFLKIVEKENCNLIIPSIKAIGHLAWTFKAVETRMIASLVKLLDEREVDVTMERQ